MTSIRHTLWCSGSNAHDNKATISAKPTNDAPDGYQRGTGVVVADE
ncbi:MAG TPA: hypothetical protein VFI79_10020 [Gemmatimonadales bacterium]|nr:hypothetical protein [Gemmatimonadales bacterium]